MTFTIEKGVPLPEHKKRYEKKYPFETMEIGDSFVVPIAPDKSPSGLFSSISQAKKRLNINLTTARVDGGIRVWRVALPLSSTDLKAARE